MTESPRVFRRCCSPRDCRQESWRWDAATDTQIRDAVSRLRGEVRGIKTTKINRHQQAAAVGLLLESFRRVRSIDLYDVQIAAGLALTAGKVTEVQTGEGKTFITAIPAFVFSLHGRGVHVATTNEYLCRRDYELIRPVLRLLGVSVGCLNTDDSDGKKRRAHNCDVTYGPGYEFGFNYLLDQIRLRQFCDKPIGLDYLDQLHGRTVSAFEPIQPSRVFAIIDEADSVLIDEANTPLVLSGPSVAGDVNQVALKAANQLVQSLHADVHYQLEGRKLTLLHAGDQVLRETLERQELGILKRPWRLYVSNALQANIVFAIDRDYVIQDGKIAIVDPHTGRIHDERTWQNGLHQAVEIKECLTPSPDNAVEARIARQRFLQHYELICGLTGTARGNEDDFHNLYGLSVETFPPHRQCQRTVLPTRFFETELHKQQFVVREAIDVAASARAVIVGTRTIEESQRYAAKFSVLGHEVAVLNGVQDREEAQIIAVAGKAGQITVTTSIAGRGTDIGLTDSVRAAGGLHVIATQFNDSSRVDRQLAGRAARQGDPGSARWTACPDDLILTMNRSNTVAAQRITNRLRQIREPDGVESPRLDRAMSNLQKQIERDAYGRRSKMVAHDRWMESIQKVVA